MTGTAYKVVDQDLESCSFPCTSSRITYVVGETFEAADFFGIAVDPSVLGDLTEYRNRFRGISAIPTLDEAARMAANRSLFFPVGDFDHFRFVRVEYDDPDDVLAVGTASQGYILVGWRSLARCTVAEEVFP